VILVDRLLTGRHTEAIVLSCDLSLRAEAVLVSLLVGLCVSGSMFNVLGRTHLGVRPLWIFFPLVILGHRSS